MGFTVNEEQNREQPACEVDPVVQGRWEIQAGGARERGFDESLSGVFSGEGPVFEEVGIHFGRHGPHEGMA